jgi:FMN phosphatase YigB (HAD superfamily)
MSGALCSFDVFDTALTRTVCDPHAVFLLVGQAAVRPDCTRLSAVDFKRARIQAEAEARLRKPGGEVTLQDISDGLAAQIGLTKEAAAALRDTELALEEDLLRPVRPVAARIAEVRSSGGRVAFLSDMYLPSSLLRRKLLDFGLLAEGDTLWVSGEEGASKASGELFRRLLSREGLSPGQVCHWGDHARSDVAVPRRLGICAQPFEPAIPNRYERILERFGEETGGAASFLAGASRLARLGRDAGTPRERALRDVAAGVAGPTLLSYVMWILDRAKAGGLRRLYFLARDGQMLLKIARLCAPAAGYEGELRYLHASRQSWRLPATEIRDEHSLQWACEDTDFLSPRSFLERMGLSPEELSPMLARHGLAAASWDTNLDKRQRGELRALIADPECRERIASVVRSRREELLAYLGQEGVLAGAPFGIVDLGWHGSLQQSLEQLLRPAGVPPPTGFYFGLSERAAGRRLERAAAFFYDERNRAGVLQRDYWVEPMLEVFCAADHGLTLRFERRDGALAPVLKAPRNERVLAWGLPLVQESILDFVRLALANTRVPIEPERLRPAVDALLGEFWNRPTRDEAEAWGSYPYSDDQTESSHREWGEPLGWFDWLRSAYRGCVTPEHQAGWAAAGLLRSPLLIRWTASSAARAGGSLRRRLRS